MQADGGEGVTPPPAAETAGSGDGETAGSLTVTPPQEVKSFVSPPVEALKLSDFACTSPESRFLRHFYAAVSLIRDHRGL